MIHGCALATAALRWLLAATATCLMLPIRVRGGELCTGVVVQLIPLANASDMTAVVDIRNAGDDRLFLVELDGRILVYKNGSILSTPFLDIRSKVAGPPDEIERGLFSVAFHPEYPLKPYFYLYYNNEDPKLAQYGDLVLARYVVSQDPDLADATSERVLMVIPRTPELPSHNGGQLHFGPNDGYLYIAVGDGGGVCDSSPPGCNAQRDELLRGKMLRIDVNQDEETPPFYGIPPDNPFTDPNNPRPNDPNDLQRDEIWAKGLRNPFRFSFDRQTGDLWIGDVGQDDREEVDFEPANTAGRNYGWPFVEGTACHTCGDERKDCPVPTLECDDPGLTAPIHQYDQDVGWTVIGGFVYRGSGISNLNGCYVFGDRGSAKLWALDPAQAETRVELLSQSRVTTFGEDRNGELYASINGKVFQLVPATPTPTGTPDAETTATPTLTSSPTHTPTQASANPSQSPTATETGVATLTPFNSPTTTRIPSGAPTPSSGGGMAFLLTGFVTATAAAAGPGARRRRNNRLRLRGS
jgi:glucose/arabinose dehydrogenase